jgi:hypothetical protein
MGIVQAALQKPLGIKIPKTPIQAPGSTSAIATVCAPDGCDATLKVIPGSVHITRLEPDQSGKSKLQVNARVEIESKGLLYVAADNDESKDCQVDIHFVDHFPDVCRGAGSSWAKVKNPYDGSKGAQSAWQQTISQCNAFCTSNSAAQGRGIGASVFISVDPTLGYPEVSVDSIDLSFSSVPSCPAAADLRVYHPKRTNYTCVDNGTQHPECEVFEQSILFGAPLTCLGLLFAYDAAVDILMNALRVGALVAINQQLKQAMSVKCSKDTECQAGALCGTTVVAEGYPAGCSDTQCLLPPIVDKV